MQTRRKHCVQIGETAVDRAVHSRLSRLLPAKTLCTGCAQKIFPARNGRRVIHIGKLTSNVRQEGSRKPLRGSTSANLGTARTRARYSSTMCSNPADARLPADVAVRLRQVIDELATASTAQTTAAPGVATDPEFTKQLARAWAIIAAADPEVAERAARYG